MRVVCWGDDSRSRDGVNATGRMREAEGLSKRVFYHLFAGFDRRVRGRARRAGSVDGIGFTHGTGVRSSGVTRRSVVRSFVATRTRDVRRDEPIASITMVLVSIPFAVRHSSMFVARAIASRSIDRSRRPRGHSTTGENGRTRVRETRDRDSDVWDRFGGSQFENVPP